MINYVNGDLFKDVSSITETTYICHIVNNCDQMGSGFVVPLMKKWPICKELYHKNKEYQQLGLNQYIQVEPNISVVHMCAQDNSKNLDRRCRYGYLAECMIDIAYWADTDDKIWCPKFGSGIGGGDWNIIEELIQEIWDDFDVTIFKYNPAPPEFGAFSTGGPTDTLVKKS